MIRRSLPTLVLALVFLFLPALVTGVYSSGGGAGETLDTVLFVAGLLAAVAAVRYRVWAGQTILEVEETVIAFEPGSRFGTGLPDPVATGIYELSAGPVGTVIAYSHSGQMPVAQSIITGVFGRKANLRRMIQARQTGMDAIKRLLEAQPAVTV